MASGVYKRTKEHCKKLAEREITNEWRQNMSKAHKGIKLSNSHRKNISKACKGIKFSKNHCANLSKTLKGKKRTKEQCKNISIAAAKQFIKNKSVHQWSRGKSGYFYSKKNNKRFHYQSSGELECLQFLELNNNVLKYQINPLRVLYKYRNQTHNYIPDVLAEYKNGKQILIEVKDKTHLKDDITKVKAKAARKYCKENNIEYKFWTEGSFLN